MRIKPRKGIEEIIALPAILVTKGKRLWKAAGRWILWMASAVLCIVFASFYGGVVPFILLKTVLAIPIVGAVYCIWVAFHFCYYQEVNQKIVVKGQPVEYTLCMNNEDRVEYGSLQIAYYQNRARLIGVSEEERYTLGRGEKKEIHTSMCCKYRGEYEVGVSHFIVRDYLDLIALRYKPISAFRIMVLPRIVPWIYEQEVFDDKAGSNNPKTRSNGEIDVQVRNYIRGDSLHRIHWKASAREGKLMTREECETRKNRFLLVVDLRKQGKDVEERLQYEDTMIEQMVAIVHTCLVRRIPCTILLQEGNWKRIEVSNPLHWKSFYESTGKLTFTATQPLEKMKVLSMDCNQIRYAVFLTQELSAGLKYMLERNFSQVNTNVVLVNTDTTSLLKL